jgi:hypothetical protein
MDLLAGPGAMTGSQLARVTLEVLPLQRGRPVPLHEQQPQARWQRRLGREQPFQHAFPQVREGIRGVLFPGVNQQ